MSDGTKDSAPALSSNKRAIASAVSLLGCAGGITGISMLGTDWLSGTFAGLYRYQYLLSGSYFMFFSAVSVPGRLDQKMGRPTSEDLRFFTPAGWAFAIWGPIFLGEMGMAFCALYAPGARLLQGPGATWLRQIAPHYAAAAAYQTLWCAAFRPWAQAAGMLWVPAAMLSLAAVSLFQAQRGLAAAAAAATPGAMTRLGYVTAHVPVAMHFAWLTAAAVLSWNGHLAVVAKSAVGARLAAAIGSCYAAAAFLGGVTAATMDPVPAAAAAWALAAVSKGHDVLRGAVSDLALDALDYSAAAAAAISLAVAVVTALG